MKKILCLLIILACSFLNKLDALADFKNETYLSDDIQKYCEEIGEQYCIAAELLEAIIETESRRQADAENGSCKGLMQISLKWHKDRMERLGVADVFDERGNILIGADYLSELFEKYRDPGVALMVYNGDSRAFEDGYISDYAKEILERSAELERMSGK